MTGVGAKRMIYSLCPVTFSRGAHSHSNIPLTPMPKQFWMQGAVHPSKRGTFKAYAKKHGGMAHAIEVGEHSKNATTRHRANFAAAARTIAARHKKR